MTGGSEIVTALYADDAPASMVATHTGEIEHRDDGVVLLFTSAVHALDAAVALVREGVGRVGVAVGEAPQERTGWAGPALAEAKRLRDAAPAGTVLVSDLVRSLVGGRRTVALRRSVVEGAWECSAATVTEATRLPPGVVGATRGTAFIPPTDALGRLRAAWRRAVDGNQQAIALSGEPGIGKTRLAAEFALEVADEALVLHGRADEDLGFPYKPIIEALTHYVRYADEATLRAHLGVEGPELFRLLPGLAERLPDLGTPTRSEPATERFLLFEAVSSLIGRAAADTPILLVIDDVHWADKPTLLLLQLLTSRPARLLIVMTYRDTEVDASHPLAEVVSTLRRGNVVRRVGLGPIAFDDVRRFGPDLDADDGFWSRVHAQTGGNPYFIEEVVRHAADVGPGDVGLPDALQEIVARRLSRLAERTRTALTIAAVCGLEFTTLAVAAGAGVDEDAALDALEDGVASGVIAEVEGAPGRWTFSHALTRESIHESLSSARRIRLHWRVGDALASVAGSSAIEVANHLVAGVAAGDPRRAAVACLAAADEARALAGFEAIVAHADRALDVIERGGIADTDLEYRAAMARADALYGLADIVGSVDAYRRAADVARAAGDPLRFADAVIGFVGPIRIEPDPLVEQFIGEALAGLGPSPSAQRIRLLSEQIDSTVAWHGRTPLHSVLDEITTAMGHVDDPIAQAAAARAVTRFWQGSPNIDAIEQAAQRGLAVPSATYDGGYLTSARGTMASRIDLAYVAVATGDRAGFDRALAIVNDECRRRGLRFGLWNAAVFRAAATIAEGRLDDARREVTAARDMVPVATGGFSATYRAQMTTIRIADGAISGLIDRLPSFIETSHRSLSVPHRAMLAGLLAQTGDLDGAQAHLDVLAAEDFADLPDDWLRPVTLRWTAEVCAALDDGPRAAALEACIRPYTGLVWIQAYAMTIEGAADRSLAQVVAAQGRGDEAATLYDRALALEEQMGFEGLAAETRRWRDGGVLASS